MKRCYVDKKWTKVQIFEVYKLASFGLAWLIAGTGIRIMSSLNISSDSSNSSNY